MKSPILGQAYVARSLNFAANELVNLYPEIAPGDAKDVASFFRCPGQVIRATITGQTGSEVRGLWVMKDYAFAVCGNGFFRVDSDFAVTQVTGVNVSGTGPVSMADNGTQIFIACNPDGYIYDYDAQTLTQITDEDFLGAVNVGYLAGSFLYNVPDSQLFQWTAITNGTDIDALDFASAEGAPDKLVGLFVDHTEAWMMGQWSIEVYGTADSTDNPYQRIQGAIIEQGCAAAFSVAKLDNSIFWLGRNKQGEGIVFRANGYTPTPVSTRAIEYAIAQWPTLDNARAFSYVQEGHSFYVLTSPQVGDWDGETWVYDATTQLWHQRAYLDADTGNLQAWRPNCHALFNGYHLVGDIGAGLTNSGKVYSLSLDTYADGTAAQKWIRAWRALAMGQNNLKRTFQHSLQIDMETGVGLYDGQGEAPIILLRWSDDGGHTWSNYHQMSIGAIGATGTRAIKRRLGSTEKLRDRVYEISGTDPVRIAIQGAQIELSGSAS